MDLVAHIVNELHVKYLMYVTVRIHVGLKSYIM